MSGAYITISANTNRVMQVFRDAANDSTDPSDLLEIIGSYLDSDVTARAKREQAPDGSTWLKSKRAEKKGGTTLDDTGELIRGVDHDVNGNALIHGLTDIYGAIHQFGGKAGRGRQVTIPKREIIGITQTQQARIDGMSLRFVQGWFK